METRMISKTDQELAKIFLRLWQETKIVAYYDMAWKLLGE